MSNRRPALGRGLGALIAPTAAAEVPGDANPEAEAAGGATPPEASAALRGAPPGVPAKDVAALKLPVDRIVPNPDQPRRVFDPEQLESLTQSIARHGVLQPVVVRSAGQGYELVVGERRWRAAQAAGLREIPAVVSDLATADRLEVAIIENVQRHDLNPIELAHAYSALAGSGATQQDIGERVGLDRSSIANHLRLLELPLDVQSDVEADRISMGHAKALLQVKGPERQRHLRDRIVSEALSVRETEKRARAESAPRVAKTPAKKAKAAEETTAPALEAVASQLQDKLQTRVRVLGDAQRGKIELEYFSGEDLDRLVAAILDGY